MSNRGNKKKKKKLKNKTKSQTQLKTIPFSFQAVMKIKQVKPLGFDLPVGGGLTIIESI